MSQSLLVVEDLQVEFAGRGRPIRAVDGVSLHIAAGETLGLVGESGSGKSTVGNAIVGLVAPAGGRIIVAGREVTHRTRRAVADHVQVVFQDPHGSLNPSRTVGSTLAEPLRVRRKLGRRAAAARVADVLERVGLPADAAGEYPGKFSGGQRQRIAIARALVLEPDLVICDEATSALDLSIQAQVLNLLLDLQRQLGMGYLFISHDIDVVRHMSHRVAILHNGRIVEQGPAEQVMDAPRHPYTRALLAAARHAVPAEATPNDEELTMTHRTTAEVG